ncbi:hypothetical protein BD408DRAFT_392872, partial [Parasitella parasitica]
MTISIRIVNLDHYMAEPGPLDRSYTPFSDKRLPKVPVLRVFGSTMAGQKVCLHIHQVFPYFFVPYDIPVEHTTDQEIQKGIFQFGTSLNEAMDLAKPQKEKNHHIAAIVLVKGVPFYGYYVGYKTYLKIYMINPCEKHQMLEILQSGAIQNISFQPHEAHLNFELQFLMDHNLYGMDWIHIEQHNVSPSFKVQFRLPILKSPQQENIYTSKTVPLDLQSDAVPKSSYCELELDITGMSILNRHDLKERNIHTSLRREKIVQAAALSHPAEESKKKLVKSLESIWVDEANRRQSRGIREPIPSVTQLDEREPRKPWLAEPELRRLMEKMMTGHTFDEASETQQPSILMPRLMTVLEAIEALYPDEYFECRKSRLVSENPVSSTVEEQITLEFTSSPTNRAQNTPANTPPSQRSKKQLKTPAERWEDEKRLLKKIWQKKNAVQKFYRKEEKRGVSAPPTIGDELTEKSSDLPRAKSAENLHPKGFQRVVVKIPKYIPKKRKKPIQKLQDTSTEISSPKDLITAAAESGETNSRDIKHDDLLETDQFENTPITSHSPVFDISHDPTIQTQIWKEMYANVEPKEIMQALESDTNHAKQETKEFTYRPVPPRIHQENLPKESVVYQEPFYSNPSDVPRFPTVFAEKEFKLPTVGLPALKEFKSVYGNGSAIISKEQVTIKSWTPSSNPPSFTQVQDWVKTEAFKKSNKTMKKGSKTQLNQPTLDNTFNFKFSASKPISKVKRIRDYVDYFSLEIHVNTRDQLLPDPQHDAVQLAFWCLQTEDLRIPSNGYQEGFYIGVIATKDFDTSRIGICNSRLAVDYAETEEQLFSLLIERIRYYDPDMLVGYEVQNASWGYLIERGAQLGYHLLDELSRVITTSGSIKRDQWGYQKASVYKVPGRHVLNVWRLMRSELTLSSYTFENVAYNLLHDRVPHYSHATLTDWYTKGPAVLKYRLFKYYMKRVQLNLDMLDASQVVSRTCESARVYGIDFYAVISRGSQYNVESIMFRIAKPENYVLITPSRSQVASQRSLEVLPLIMEPLSQFYSSPIVVLDFQSLYPSIMIAYNYCYSTCLGRIRKPDETSRFGVLPSFEPDDGLLDTLKDYINVSPNGIMFVKPEVRKSLLAKMLSELLDTRVMIKRAMKDYKEDSGLLRMLDAKQLTLKLLANVTYGYTSASFSGRMPSVEIADSIVASGRETLERSINLINETKKWGARVVYGDTDSMFIYLPGKTKDEAFILGNEIAETVTKMNPAPVKLKFEKVYHPTVLLAKKRYVGFKYENSCDQEPVFEAKGIETVRRDGTAATQKVLESCLKILFRTQDMSELKAFLYNQWTKILSNRVLLQDFIISKEVRMGTYSSRGGPNGAMIAQAQMDIDPRAEPQYGERVPYVVVYRGPHAKLKDKVVRPEELLNDSSLRLDAEYYIRKQIIPPLSRIFNLMGVDILSMYEAMPRSLKVAAMKSALNTAHQAKSLTRIDQYYSSSYCVVCRKLADQGTVSIFLFLCEQCKNDAGSTVFTLLSRQQMSQDKFRKLLQACQDCSKVSPLDAMVVVDEELQYADIPCDSLDCPIFYKRLKAKEDVRVTDTYNTLIQDLNDSQN